MKASSLIFLFALGLTNYSCNKRKFSEENQTKSFENSEYAAWEKEREARQADLDSYLNANHMKQNFLWFRDFPVGNQGLPALIYRILPTLSQPLTQIWGEPDTKMAKLGLGPHPAFEDYPFPLGMGWTRGAGLLPVNVGVFSCGACHIGRVIGPDKKIIHLYGAPNTQFDAHGFTNAVIQTSNNETFNAQNIRKAIETNNQSPMWLYGRNRPTHILAEKIDTTVISAVAEKVVQAVKESSADRQSKIDRYLVAGPYKNGKGGSMEGGNPGRLDAFSTAIALMSNLSDASPSELVYQKASMTDIMSVWGQGRRAVAQWDGSVRAELIRNLGAELGVVGSPKNVDVKNAVLTTELLKDLPPPPYPFAINLKLADKGKVLFQQHCATCHFDRNETIYSPEEIGTDPNRANVFTIKGRELLVTGLRAACPTSVPQCRGIKDEDILKPSQAKRGYVAAPLDGIWARAPYLHNGSIPTLMHLLVPELRLKEDAQVFWRGNISYDERNVGFEWRTNKAPEGFSQGVYLDEERRFLAAKQFDTRLEGMSNKGHENHLRSDGQKWSADPVTAEGQETLALLEYLKTL